MPFLDVVLLGALAVYVALYCVWSLTSHLPAAARSFRSDLAFLPVGLSVVLLAARASRAPELDRATRRAWRLLGAALFFFWLIWESLTGRFFAGALFFAADAKPAPLAHTAGAVAAFAFVALLAVVARWKPKPLPEAPPD